MQHARGHPDLRQSPVAGAIEARFPNVDNFDRALDNSQKWPGLDSLKNEAPAAGPMPMRRAVDWGCAQPQNAMHDNQRYVYL